MTRRWLTLLLGLSILIVAACTGTADAPATLSSATSTASDTPTLAPTLPPDLTPQPPEPCVIVATRTPPPDAPTAAPGPGGAPSGVIDPHVDVCASATTLHVGELLYIGVRPAHLGLPVFRLTEQGPAADAPALSLGSVRYDGLVESGETGLLRIISAEGELWQGSFTLQARAPGDATLRVTVSGEIHYGYPGPAAWSARTSDAIVITILP